MLRSLDCELESALLHFLQAEDRARMYHYPEEIQEAVKRLKLATYRVRSYAQKFREANSIQAFREATNGAKSSPMSSGRDDQSAVAVAAAVKEQPRQGGRAGEVTPVARELPPANSNERRTSDGAWRSIPREG